MHVYSLALGLKQGKVNKVQTIGTTDFENHKQSLEYQNFLFLVLKAIIYIYILFIVSMPD
jgi:hypothetical protein